jgi:hypothetical protein
MWIGIEVFRYVAGSVKLTGVGLTVKRRVFTPYLSTLWLSHFG